MPAGCVRTDDRWLRNATAAAFALALSACAATSACARPCDAIEAASGKFGQGKVFSGKVIEVVDARTIRIIPQNDDAKANNWCDVELISYGLNAAGAAEEAKSKNFLTDFILNEVVDCIPVMPSMPDFGPSREEMPKTVRGGRVLASCDVEFPLGLLRQVFERARR